MLNHDNYEIKYGMYFVFGRCLVRDVVKIPPGLGEAGAGMERPLKRLGEARGGWERQGEAPGRG